MKHEAIIRAVLDGKDVQMKDPEGNWYRYTVPKEQIVCYLSSDRGQKEDESSYRLAPQPVVKFYVLDDRPYESLNSLKAFYSHATRALKVSDLEGVRTMEIHDICPR